MAEVLTKTVMKQELRRRIAWFEKSYTGIEHIDNWGAEKVAPLLLLEAGRYQSYRNMLEQIELGLFVGGGK